MSTSNTTLAHCVMVMGTTSGAGLASLFPQLWATIAKENAGAAGDALDRQVIEAAVKQTKELGCFVAGTLVHTREGLRPIEQIQVGDLVLSKPEDGSGEQSYQPVTRTFSYENRELFWLRWQLQIDQPGEPKWERGEVAVTGAHPIWVTRLARFEGKGEKYPDGYAYSDVNDWMSVGELYLRMWKQGHTRSKKGITLVYTQVADGRPATIRFIEPLLQCPSDPQWNDRLEVPVKDAAVTFNDGEETPGEDLWGYTICFGPRGAFQSKQVPTTSMGNREDLEDLEISHYTGYDTESAMSVVKRSGGYLPARRTVYNIEVANTHSYFVGELGLWVHNTSGSEWKPLPSSPTKNVSGYVNEEAETPFKVALASTCDGKSIGFEPDISVLNSGGSAAQAIAI